MSIVDEAEVTIRASECRRQCVEGAVERGVEADFAGLLFDLAYEWGRYAQRLVLGFESA